jgi:DNA-binding beta-propeller fold protein YncE
MRTLPLYLLFTTLFLLSCSYKLIVNADDAEIYVNNQRIESALELDSPVAEIMVLREGYIPWFEKVQQPWLPLQWQDLELNPRLEKRRYPFDIELIQPKEGVELYIDGSPYSEEHESLDHGQHQFSFVKEIVQEDGDVEKTGLFSWTEIIDGPKSMRMQSPEISSEIVLRPLGLFPTGPQPKQLHFDPSGKYIYITLLGGWGAQVFSVEEGRIITNLRPPEYDEKYGFVEGLFLAEKSRFLMSQMTTAKIHEYDVEDPAHPKLLRTIDAGGIWSKVIAYCEELDVLAVSNWVSDDISIIDYQTGRLTRLVSGLDAPRGIVFSGDGAWLYAASFDGGTITKISTKTWEKAGEIFKEYSAMRHAVLTKDDSKLYVSAMGYGEVYEIDTASFTIQKTFTGFIKTNTIALTPDENYLIISSRGPNNPESYLKKSLEGGFITIIDLTLGTEAARIPGGLQPTGLTVTETMFAFSNFQDNTLEIFEFNK